MNQLNSFLIKNMNYNNQPNVQELQSNVVKLLAEISSLMNRASIALSADSSGRKYADFHKQVDNERRRVENLELVMAIVAPMKAGKSTIINAIVGQNLLPSRNAAMTTLPTEIILRADISEPILILSPEIIKVFKHTVAALQSQISNNGGIQWAQKKLSQHPHLMNLLDNIHCGICGFVTRAETVGREEIIKTLTGLNDVIRLCTIIDPSIDPLRALTDVPQIETPFLRSQLTTQSEQMGNLIIVDTPGPNEAGENLKLTHVVNKQLKQSSIVLIVLDFTQLKTKASEEVKKEVQKVIQLRGKETLYVLINKVDARKKGDMTIDEVKQFVEAQFGISSSNNNSRIFEISASYAFSANNFLLELQRNPNQNIAQMEAAQLLAQSAFGALWEETLKDIDNQQIKMAAQRVWKKSGFSLFLEKAIVALMESTAPRCIKSALNLSRSHLEQLRNDVKLQRGAVAANAEELKKQIQALEADLNHLEVCKGRLKQVDAVKTQLQGDIRNLLTQLSSSDLPYDVLQKFKGEKKKTFEDYSAAISFQEKLEKEIIEIVNTLLDEARTETQRLITKSQRNLVILLERETEPIIKEAQKRLNKAFNINLSFQPLKISSDEMSFVKPRRGSVETKTRYWKETEYYTDYETRIERRFYTLWLWEHKKTVPVRKSRELTKSKDYYEVSKSDIVARFKESIKANVKQVEQRIKEYIQEDFQHQVDAFFQNLDDYLGSYRDNLKQAQENQKLDGEKKQQLMKNLESLVPETDAQIGKAASYLEDASRLMPNGG
ncbi:MAG: dynamin family protein [Symploca sp. SIO2E6]|nr:dynamin family protein [Symploca sp. SIO2E6]